MSQQGYYQVIYKERLKWTRHFIPVRIFTDNIYVEAYIQAPPKGGLLVAKIASLPDGMYDEVLVSSKDIYPTARDIRGITESSAAEGIKSWEGKISPLDLTEDRLLSIEKVFGPFTINELLSALGRDSLLDKERALIKPTGSKKMCMISCREEDTYLPKSKKRRDKVKYSSLEDLRNDYIGCTRCKLGEFVKARGSDQVFSDGTGSEVGMIIGESPWTYEERDGLPFHPDAPAGNLLKRVMDKVGLSRQDFYFTNAVLCRPLEDTSVPKGGYSNLGDSRKPTFEEITACNNRLRNEVILVGPKVVVLLGSIAYLAWFGKQPNYVSRSRGWQDSNTSKKIYFTYHPSYIARMENSQDLGARKKMVEVKKEYLEDWTEIAKEIRKWKGKR